MKLDFKRVMSSVLAFVMLFSSLVMVNVVSVSAAATGDFYFIADDFYSGATPSNSSKIAPSATQAVKDVFGSVPTSTNYYSALGTRAGTTVTNVPTPPDGRTIKNEVRWGGGRTLNFTPANDGKFTAYVYVNASNASSSTKKFVAVGPDSSDSGQKNPHNDITTGNTVIPIVVDVKANELTYVYFSGDLVMIALQYAAETGTKYTITGDCSGIGAKEKFTLTNNSVAPAATYEAVVNDDGSSYTATVPAKEAPFAANTKLDVSAEGYSVVPTQITLAAGDDEYSFKANDTLAFTSAQYTVTLKAVDEEGTAVAATAYAESAPSEAISIPVEGKAVQIDNGSTEKFYVGDPDNYLPNSVEVTDSKSGQDVTVSLTKIPKPQDGNVLNSSVFYSTDPDLVAESDIAKSSIQNLYNLNISGKINGYDVSAAKVQMYDNSGKLQKRININANATIKYTPQKDGKLETLATTGSNNKERGYTITPAPAEGNGTVTYTDSSTHTTTTHTLTAGTPYTITVTGGAINFYDIKFTPSEESGTTYTVKMGADQGDYPEATAVLDDPSNPTKATITWSANETYKAGSATVDLTDIEGNANVTLIGTEYTINYAAIADNFEKNTPAPTGLTPVPLGTTITFDVAYRNSNLQDSLNKDAISNDGYLNYYFKTTEHTDEDDIRLGEQDAEYYYIKFIPEDDCYLDIKFSDNDILLISNTDEPDVDVYRSITGTASTAITRTVYLKKGVEYTLQRTANTARGNVYLYSLYFHDATQRIGIGNYNVKNGATFTVDLTSRNFKGLIGIKKFEIQVAYNAALLEYVSDGGVAAGASEFDTISATGPENSDITGYKYITITGENTSGTQETLSDDILCHIKFKALDNGTTSLPVNVVTLEGNTTSEIPTYTAVNGSVVISSDVVKKGNNIVTIEGDTLDAAKLAEIYSTAADGVTLFERIVGTVAADKNAVDKVEGVGITIVADANFDEWENSSFAASNAMGNVSINTVYKDVFNSADYVSDANLGEGLKQDETKTYFETLVTSTTDTPMKAYSYTVVNGVRNYYNTAGELSSVAIDNTIG